MPCILVADDNTNIQRMVALALEDRGIKVIAVGNGEAAVRRLPDLNPDLVLADVFMPVRNGYEVCEFVKKDKRFANIPVILLVGAFDPLDEKETRRVGADGVLKKPFVPPDPLIAMVLSILEKNPRAAAELAAMKPKEAKDALEPHHLASLEAPAPSAVPFKAEVPLKIEPKPLPEFPEPSAEEAALLYGFGKGRRTFEDDEMEALKEPLAELDNPVEEEFDGSSTTNDWRRTAMDFEVPPEAANMPAFSSQDNLEPMSFPSEPAGPDEQPSLSNDEEEIEAGVQGPESEVETVEAPAGNGDLKSEHEPNPEPSFAAKVTHWMDLVASPESKTPTAGWMDTLTAAQRSETPAEVRAEHSAEETSQPAIAGATAEVSSDSAEPSNREQPEQFAAAPEESSSHQVVASEEFVSQTNSSSEESKDAPVAPESLLVSSESQIDSNYASPVEEPVLLQSASETFSEETPLHAPSEEVAANNGASAPSFESSLDPFDNRLPAAHPSYREALSEIPFLNPPSGFDPHASETSAADSETVDAVVRRVLEKLEPQLHALLSQGVLKPLVENLLQTELAKKEK